MCFYKVSKPLGLIGQQWFPPEYRSTFDPWLWYLFRHPLRWVELKSVICVAVAVKLDVAGSGRAGMSTVSGSLAMFKSKIGVSRSSSSVGSTSCAEVG
uniref:Uncharacterized protein n=1 Tax=Romanomermis culicivorax TaxID=13658 RepID=A0A915IPT5_ROMCU